MLKDRTHFQNFDRLCSKKLEDAMKKGLKPRVRCHYCFRATRANHILVHVFKNFVTSFHFIKLVSGLIDSSGIRISITKSLRTHDAGMLEMGYEVNWRQIVPPHQNDFLSVGYCSESCLAQVIQ